MSPIQVAMVTGASGFIGRRLCARLKDSDVGVIALMRRQIDGPWDGSLSVDLASSSPDVSAMRDVDTVFHLAGKAHALSEVRGDEQQYAHVNVDGTRRVLEAAERAGVRRVIFFSSVKAMGEGGAECLDESHVEAPETPYGRSKLAAEKLVLSAARTQGMHTASLRLTPVYGPHGKGNLDRMLRAVVRGRFPPLPDAGDRRSMIHVDDVVEAALVSARSPIASGKTYIVTDGHAYSTRGLYVSMCNALGRPVPRWTVPSISLVVAARLGDGVGRIRGRRPGFDSDALYKLRSSAWYNSARLERDLGFRPRWDFDSALPSIIAGLAGGAAGESP